MNPRADALTVALTGQLPFVFVIAAILALPIAFLLLRLYRSAVVRSMRRRAQSDLLETKGYLPPEPEHRVNDAPLAFVFAAGQATQGHPEAQKIFRMARRRRWATAVIHAIAGGAFAAVMTAAFLLSGKMDLAPWRFAFFTWINVWPVLIAIDLVLGPSRRSRVIGLAGYFGAGVVLGAAIMARNPGLPVGQLLYLWLNNNAIPTVLLWIFLNRRIRALGPLVLVFMVFGIAGATLTTSFVGTHPKLLQAVGEFAISIGLGAVGFMIGLHAIGFILFALVGWLTVNFLRQLYERKTISEQTITVDAMWLLFGLGNSFTLAFNGLLWVASGLVAFAAYKIGAAMLFELFGMSRRTKQIGPRLLLLRVFALGKRSEQLYDTLGKSWRMIGSIQMIAGPDLATTTIEPHEFLDFVSGKLDRRFIDSGRTLDVRIGQMDLTADYEGQYRVTEFFCHDDTWKLTLSRLADDCEAVLMDLRGFTQGNSGCIFEINEIFNVVPLRRVVFAVDRSTDQAFMRATMEQTWRRLKDRSPNRHLTSGRVKLIELGDPSVTGVRDLLSVLCTATTDKPGADEAAVEDRPFQW